MSLTFGFFNSVGGDREYDAVQISSIFDGVITDGVFETVDNGLEVINTTGMNIMVRSGKAWFNHTWTLNDSDMILPIAPSSLVYDRIDTVVLEVNASSEIRANSLKIITGIAAPVPLEPTLTNTPDIHQYPLAYVTVPVSTSEIILNNIADVRGSGLCPYVTVPQAAIIGGISVLEVQVFT